MNTARPLRADARRNATAVIDAARILFAEKGVDIPMEEIGRSAGVGKGTLYRHFPTRDHLLAGDARSALNEWLRDFDRSAQEYRGLRAVVSAGIGNSGSAIFTDCAAMKQRAARLLDRAQGLKLLRSDIEITPLLSLVAALPEQFRNDDGSSQLLDIVLRGLVATYPSSSRVAATPHVTQCSKT
jgi:AcrR family transcriptional regulator